MGQRTLRAYVPTCFLFLDDEKIPDLTDWPEGGYENATARADTDEGSYDLASGQKYFAKKEVVHNDDPSGKIRRYYRDWDKSGNEPRQGTLVYCDDIGDPEDPRSVIRRIDLGNCTLGSLKENAGNKQSPEIKKITAELCIQKWEDLPV